MIATMKSHRLSLAATCLIIIVAMAIVARSQATGITVTLAGQSMIRSDLRVTAADATPVMSALLTGDVKFTNFEAVVVQPGEPNASTPETRPNGGWLTPPGAMGSLQALGFNLLSLSNNHAWDLKIPGIQNTVREATRLNLAHAGIGNTLDEAVAP